MVGNKSYISQTEAIATKPPSLGLPVQPGTAVGDLQALERAGLIRRGRGPLPELIFKPGPPVRGKAVAATLVDERRAGR